MAEKLTDRTALAVAPATGDFLHIVDVSDTTDGSAGTSKKITVANLLSGFVKLFPVFNTVALQAAYTVPASMTIAQVTMGSDVVSPNSYTYSGTTLTFDVAPDDIYAVTIFYT